MGPPMLNLVLALLAGIVTIAAPCTLPMLPILLGASVGQTGKAAAGDDRARLCPVVLRGGAAAGRDHRIFDFDPNACAPARPSCCSASAC